MNRVSTEHVTACPSSILAYSIEVGKASGRLPAADQRDNRFLLLLLSGCYLPVLLLWSGLIPFAYRFYILPAVLAFYIACSFFRGYHLDELGFTTANLIHSLRWNLLLCLFGTFGLYLVYTLGFIRSNHTHYLPWIYAAYIFFLAPVQELIFRGILFAEMKKNQITDKRLILLISTCSFCFLHIIYRHPPMLVISAACGLLWGIIFLKWPNIWGVSLSHSLLGALAMFLGVI